MIKVEVRYFATLRVDGKKKEEVSIPIGTTADELLKTLSIPMEDIAILLVNGINSDANTVLNDGDTVSLFPPVGGG
ncbi:MAG: MoaD/ThiS family protein [Gudongella sp.]|jgi:molybdopterin converting factor small subunit|nr:MoaD/ThiS family protein [Gudongella sp.]